MRVFLFALITSIFINTNANAQMSSQKDAAYLAILKVVADYKINDEEEAANIAKLRTDARFNNKLKEMLSELENTKNKNSKNDKILKVLLDAGKEIDNILNVI